MKKAVTYIDFVSPMLGLLLVQIQCLYLGPPNSKMVINILGMNFTMQSNNEVYNINYFDGNQLINHVV